MNLSNLSGKLEKFFCDEKKVEKLLLTFIVVFFLLSRLIPAIFMPFIQDESLYSMMIEEQAHNPTIIQTFLGEEVSWKPPLFFWIYSVTSRIFLFTIEFTYRYPSIIFGAVSLSLLYRLFPLLGLSRKMSLVTLMVYVVCFPSIYSDATVLTDSFNFFLLLAALYVYLKKDLWNLGSMRHLIAGLLLVAAFFVKLILAFMPPLIAVIYFVQKRELKEFLNVPFIVSVLLVVATYFAYYQLLDSHHLAAELYGTTFGGHDIPLNPEKSIQLFVSSLISTLLGIGPFFALALVGFYLEWRKNITMTTWFLLSAFPLLVSTFMPWYFLPVLPAIAYFSAVALVRPDGKERLDALFATFFTIALLILLYYHVSFYLDLYKSFNANREAGIFLQNKDPSLIIGPYTIGVINYKFLPIYRSTAEPFASFGWILDGNLTLDKMHTAAYNYSSYPDPKTPYLSTLFVSSIPYVRPVNLSHFDYVVITGTNYTRSPPGWENLYYSREARIYKVN
ncbi:hypothetical protein HY990_02060 [Candidatus Micrarchaeota archaeon]|nr:hypothetical protein [Candidatus Micrarchaeota archaeon]